MAGVVAGVLWRDPSYARARLTSDIDSAGDRYDRCVSDRRPAGGEGDLFRARQVLRCGSLHILVCSPDRAYLRTGDDFPRLLDRPLCREAPTDGHAVRSRYCVSTTLITLPMRGSSNSVSRRGTPRDAWTFDLYIPPGAKSCFRAISRSVIGSGRRHYRRKSRL